MQQDLPLSDNELQVLERRLTHNPELYVDPVIVRRLLATIKEKEMASENRLQNLEKAGSNPGISGSAVIVLL